MQKKKVLIVFNSANEFGGVERHVADIVEGLQSEFDITVSCKQGKALSLFEGFRFSHLNVYPKFDFDPLYIYKIYRYIKSNKINVVHAHQLKAGSQAVFAAFLAGAKIRIYHVHTPITQWRLGFVKRFTTYPLNILINYITANFFSTNVIALTKTTMKEKVRKEHISKKKIIVIPNGVRVGKEEAHAGKDAGLLKEWGVGKGAVVVGSLSRLTEEKGHDVLIKAFSETLKGLPDESLKLVIAGEGYLRKSLELLSKDLGISDMVLFTGRFKQEEKYRILSSFDLFVFPSMAEGFGIALIEAMASRLPIISSDLPVLLEVGGDTIGYFARGDYNDLAGVMKKYIKGKKKYLKRRKYPYERVVSRYSMRRFTDNYRKLYSGRFAQNGV